MKEGPSTRAGESKHWAAGLSGERWSWEGSRRASRWKVGGRHGALCCMAAGRKTQVLSL